MPALLALLLGLVTGCGEERSFTAEEFVEGVNREGVELRLSDELFTDREDERVYAVELEPLARLPGSEGGHAGGSISVHEDTGRADEELASCRQSADLLCYQAANVVLVLEGGGIEAQRLGVAIERLAER